MDEKMVVSHDDIKHLLIVEHYDDHPARTESPEFVRVREDFHRRIENGEIPACWINNGHCEGHTEIHHNEIEYSASSEVDWELIAKELGFDHVDSEQQMLQLCRKHHQGVGTGIHKMPAPIWKLQKYMNTKNITLFEAAVAHLLDQHPNHVDHTHEDHHAVNRKAAIILKKLAHNPNDVYEGR